MLYVFFFFLCCVVSSYGASPSGRRSVPSFGEQEAQSQGEQDVGDGEELVFRGLILRHQLVALLKNKVFFNEGDGVRYRDDSCGCIIIIINP